MTNAEAEELTCRVAGMTRDSLVDTLRRMQCGFPIDFTDEYLASVSMERLRHIVLAAAIHDDGRAA